MRLGWRVGWCLRPSEQGQRGPARRTPRRAARPEREAAPVPVPSAGPDSAAGAALAAVSDPLAGIGPSSSFWSRRPSSPRPSAPFYLQRSPPPGGL